MARISGPHLVAPIDPGSTRPVTAATNANPCVLTCPNHGQFGSITTEITGGTGDWTAINNIWSDHSFSGLAAIVVDSDHISIQLDSTAFAPFAGQVVSYMMFPASAMGMVAGPLESTLHPGVIYAIVRDTDGTPYGIGQTKYFLCKSSDIQGTTWTQTYLDIEVNFFVSPFAWPPYFDPITDVLTCALNSNNIDRSRKILTINLDTNIVSVIDVSSVVPSIYVSGGVTVPPPYIHPVRLPSGDFVMLSESQPGYGGHAATPPQVWRYSNTGGTWSGPVSLTPWTNDFDNVIADSSGNFYVFSMDYVRTWSLYLQVAYADGSVSARQLIFDATPIDPFGDLSFASDNQVLIVGDQLVYTNTQGQGTLGGGHQDASDIWISNSLTDLTFTGIGTTLINEFVALGWNDTIRTTDTPTATFQIFTDSLSLYAAFNPNGWSGPDEMVIFQYLGGGNWSAPVFALGIGSYRPPGATSASQTQDTIALSDGTLATIAAFGLSSTSFPYYYNYTISSASDLGPNVTCGTVPSGLLATPYSHTFPASGGTPPYEFFLASGALPPGISLDPSTGTVTGTPTTPGNYCFGIQGADANLSVSCDAPPDGTVATFYSHFVIITGGTLPYTVSIVAGSLPTGTTIRSSGEITGSPSVAGAYDFTVQATDGNGFVAEQSCAILIHPAPLRAFCWAPTQGTESSIQTVPVDFPLVSFSYGVPPYTVGIISGALPPGVSLGNDGQATGTPTVAGFYSFRVQVSDSGIGVVSFDCHINVEAVGIYCNVSCGFQVGVPRTCQLVAFVGMVSPYTLTITSGFLPTGLTLNNDGTVSGTASGVPVDYCFGIHAVDSVGATFDRNCCVDIVLPPGAPVLECPAQGAQITVFYDSRISIVTGTQAFPPLVFSIVAGSLPPGLTLDASTGHISGFPTVAGGYTMQFHLLDSHGQTADITCGITVAPAPPVVFSCNSPQGAFIGAPYSHPLSASFGTPPYTYSLDAGVLPPGLTMDSAGIISGTPTTLGTYFFTPMVTDSHGGIDEALCAITVTTVTISCNNPSQGIVGIPYSYRLFIVGGAAPYTVAITSGSAPNGLSISDIGWITGTPTTAGTFVFTVQVTDAASRTAHTTCSIVVVDHPQNIANCCILIVSPFSLSCASPPQGSLLVPYSHQLSLVGSSPPYVITVTSGTLPPGLSVGPTGLISGTPVTPGTFTFTIRATDLLGDTATATCSIVIVAVKRSGAGLAWRFGPRYPRSEVERR